MTSLKITKELNYTYNYSSSPIGLSCILTFLLFLSSLGAQVLDQAIDTDKNRKRTKVFLLAGQSNMGGKGDGNLLTEEEKKELISASEQIDFFYKGRYSGPLSLTEASSYDRENYNLEKSFGPELFFGIEMAKAFPQERFVFIKSAIGGTSLYGAWNSDWNREQAKVMNEEDGPKLYDDFQVYIREILSSMDPETYEFAGMLWVQGEADSKVPIAGQNYGKNLQRLIESMRSFTHCSDLPFMMFQVGKGKVVKGMKKVERKMENVILIPQNNNPESSDFYIQYPPPKGHYTYESMKKIGKRFAEEYISLMHE